MALLDKPADEFDLYVKSLAVQLRNMNQLQSGYAQDIINQVVFQRNLNKFEESTTILTPHSYPVTPSRLTGDSGSSTP